MKTKTLASIALIAILLSIVSTVAIANSGQLGPSANNQNDNHQNNNHLNSNHQDDDDHGRHFFACNNLTIGETLTVTGLTGHYANASNREQGGNASGTFSFKVTAKYAEGCTLSITAGSFKLNTTTYTITGGSIVLNHGGRSGEGTGTTSGGTFLISLAGLQGTSKSANVGAVGLDVQTGKEEFLVHLHSPMTHGDSDESD
jgi:hypothetical protein